jgi:tetratricopeptide (TPR) repeat protein
MLVKSLNEIAPLIGQRVLEARKILSFLCKGKLEIMAIFDHFQIYTHASVEEAAQAVNGVELSSFKKYGSQLLRYLKQMVSLIVTPESTVLENIAVDMQLIRILEPHGSKNTIRKMGLEMLEEGLKHERPSWVTDALRVLMRSYSNAGYDRIKEFDEYNMLLLEYDEYLSIQNQAERLYLIHYSLKQRKKSNNKEMIEHLRVSEEFLRAYNGQIKSFSFHVFYYVIAFDLFFITGQYQSAYNFVQQAIEYFKNRDYDINYILSLYYAKLAYCASMLKKFDKIDECVTYSQKISTIGSVNWFSALQMFYFSYMKKGDYLQAAAHYTQATRHKNFVNQSESFLETWHITGAYLYIGLVTSGQPLPKGLKSYKSSKLINEISNYQSDKGGLYAAALTASLLLTAIEGHKDKIVERVDALEKYRERYLLEGDTPRTAVLYKILITIAKAGFQKRFYANKMPALQQELADCGKGLDYLPFEWELIPNEALVEMIGTANVGLLRAGLGE